MVNLNLDQQWTCPPLIMTLECTFYISVVIFVSGWGLRPHVGCWEAQEY